MPMRTLRPSSEAEMIAVFLRGELASPRFGPRVREVVDERLVLEPDLEDANENEQRDAALTAVRGYAGREGVFGRFPHEVHWEWVGLTRDEVLSIRYIDYSYWVELSGGSRRPVDAVERIRAGDDVFGVPSTSFLDVELEDPPPLIVVGDGTKLVVLEGHVRLTVYALRPELLPDELEVLLGRSPRIAEWALW
jgi:hypothetical protein